MDFYAVFLFIYLPGFIVGFIVGLKFIKGAGIVGKLIACLLLGLLFAFIVAPIIGGTIGVIREKYTDVMDQKEATYFLSALSGNFTDTEIVKHYSKDKISNKADVLIRSNPISVKSKPERIQLLADLLFLYEPAIVGLLAALPEAPFELKQKAALGELGDGGTRGRPSHFHIYSLTESKGQRVASPNSKF